MVGNSELIAKSKEQRCTVENVRVLTCVRRVIECRQANRPGLWARLSLSLRFCCPGDGRKWLWKGDAVFTMNEILAKLRHIQRLWIELGRTTEGSAEYEILVKEIRILSTEYQALVEAHTKSQKG